MIRKPDGSFKGSAFVTYGSQEEATLAIMSLNEVVTLNGSSRPLAVRVADQPRNGNEPVPPKQNFPAVGYYAGYPEEGKQFLTSLNKYFLKMICVRSLLE